MVIDRDYRALRDCGSYERYEAEEWNQILVNRTYFRPERIFLALFVLLENNLQNLLVGEFSRLNLHINDYSQRRSLSTHCLECFYRVLQLLLLNGRKFAFLVHETSITIQK